MHYHVFETPGGFCGMAWTDAGIARFQLPTPDRAATERLLLRRILDALAAEPPPEIAHAVVMVQRYFAGERVDFSGLHLDLSGQSALFRDIYAALRGIGWGQTTTYGALARTIGAEGWEAARDVGQAMAKNPVALIIPCHRCLAAGGRIGGFSAPGGEISKLKMLELEGVRLAPDAPEQPSLF
jgi:methylated-DNA-[protein]-cysteine S-methyltransferase